MEAYCNFYVNATENLDKMDIILENFNLAKCLVKKYNYKS